MDGLCVVRAGLRLGWKMHQRTAKEEKGSEPSILSDERKWSKSNNQADKLNKNWDAKRRDRMIVAKWPRSKGKQAAIATIFASLAAIWVLANTAMQSFNDFYFAPHKAYPYPYSDVHSAHMALFRNCAAAFLGVFVVLFALQRMFIAFRRN
jgi:hypothetical protein